MIFQPMPTSPLWQIQSSDAPPDAFVQAVQQYTGDLPGKYLAQLLWQRQLCTVEGLAGFLDATQYTPASPFAFGDEMEKAIARLQHAYATQERVAIWGDFDADGITATAVLWEGLGQFFPQGDRLTYTIPNRLTESHGLSIAGIDRLAQAGYTLIITCDTGSTNLKEIHHANALGIDVIVTDHHTLPSERPPVVALINPRSLDASHPLATLSGVAVAFKVVEALYETLPHVPTQPLEALLDLVAIGLVADLVELRGDCRYLAQRGIEQLQLNQGASPPRPGIAKLLEFCRGSGDRPTDISFGIGPRINAISRIQGDASFAVELLTSRDRSRCETLALETELANARRRVLQKDVVQQVTQRLAQMDLSTTHVIVLEDPNWSVGVLGLVAGQIAQEYGKPTILLTRQQRSGDRPSTIADNLAAPTFGSSHLFPQETILACGSARSVGQIDLYQLVAEQSHLLHRFGGHPFAAGLSLPLQNVPLFTEAINRQLRQQQATSGEITVPTLQADLTVTVAELGKDLFRELKLLEPCGMGNPAPKLWIQNVWFENASNRNIRDVRGNKLRYIKTDFVVRDDTGAKFPGVWWGHYRDELPPQRCDVIAELDFNTFHKRYEIRLLAVRPSTQQAPMPTVSLDWIVDWRQQSQTPDASVLAIAQCPSRWDELRHWMQQAMQTGKTLAIAYPPPPDTDPTACWEQLIGIAKYLSRTQQSISSSHLRQKLSISDRTFQISLHALQVLGFEVTLADEALYFRWHPAMETEAVQSRAIAQCLTAIQEDRFRQQYFATVPLEVVKQMAMGWVKG